MIKVLGIGDNVCDKYLHTGTIYPGGNAMNISVFSHFLGAEAAYLGVFGDDEVGEHIYGVVKDLGIDLSHCRFEHGDNGLARVLLVDGDRTFLPGNRGGISRVKPPVLSGLDMEYIRGFDLVHTSIYSSMEHEMERLGSCGVFLSMDFSNHGTDEYLRTYCPFVDAAIVSCGNAPMEEILEKIETIKSYGCRHIVIATRGSKGAVVDVDGKLYEQSPCLVKAIDTLGAGDSFLCCFLVNYLDGMKNVKDFPETGEMKGLTTIEAYKDTLIKISLYRAAVFSAEECGKYGSFGHGKVVGLTEEDKKYME